MKSSSSIVSPGNVCGVCAAVRTVHRAQTLSNKRHRWTDDVREMHLDEIVALARWFTTFEPVAMTCLLPANQARRRGKRISRRVVAAGRRVRSSHPPRGSRRLPMRFRLRSDSRRSHGSLQQDVSHWLEAPSTAPFTWKCHRVTRSKSMSGELLPRAQNGFWRNTGDGLRRCSAARRMDTRGHVSLQAERRREPVALRNAINTRSRRSP